MNLTFTHWGFGPGYVSLHVLAVIIVAVTYLALLILYVRGGRPKFH